MPTMLGSFGDQTSEIAACNGDATCIGEVNDYYATMSAINSMPPDPTTSSAGSSSYSSGTYPPSSYSNYYPPSYGAGGGYPPPPGAGTANAYSAITAGINAYAASQAVPPAGYPGAVNQPISPIGNRACAVGLTVNPVTGQCAAAPGAIPGALPGALPGTPGYIAPVAAAWYSNPTYLLFGGLLVGGAIYLATKKS
jgi:hypothetical protein